MSSATRLSDQTWIDKYLPDDDAENDPRWVRVEVSEDVFMWQWSPATIDVLNGAFVAQVGARIERCSSLDAADWWCTQVMGVLPMVSEAALNAPAPQRWFTVKAAVNVAAMAVSFALVFLPLAVL
jgi:hypothetical protein